MQPKSTKNLVNVSTYLVGPDKVIAVEKTQGRDFMLSDRFFVEFLIFINQKVDPGID